MRLTMVVTGQTPFQCEYDSLIIGSSAAGYTLYHGPSSNDLKPYKDADGNNVEVAANHPLTVMCARGTWFQLLGNTGDVKIIY